MRNYKRFLLIGLSAFLITGCGGGDGYKDEPRQEGDKYVDVLPTSTSDGVTLHAFCWTFNQIRDNLDAIKEAGYKIVQTSPVTEPKSGGASWWAFYQPLSFTIATNSPLGTKAELQALCSEAEERGIDVIVDIVFNHMSTTGAEDEKGLPVVDPAINEFEPYIYAHQDECFHHYVPDEHQDNGTVTQWYRGLPDLNTSNTHVQERALALLKECIDVGVDGFRFDAAKHIETPDDAEYPSSFWTNTLGVAKEYYKTKNNTTKELYAYGEILNDVGGERPESNYTKLMKITDNAYGSSLQTAILSGTRKAQPLVDTQYCKASPATDTVTWVESHDTFTTESGHFKTQILAREWAVVASRKNSNPLFLAHTDDDFTVGKVANYDFEDPRMSAINHFHNRFIAAEEYRNAQADSYYICERYTSTDQGAVLVNLKGTGEQRLNFTNLEDGYYFDQITGRQYHIENKSCYFLFEDNSGVIVLTKTANYPTPILTISSRGQKYAAPVEVTFSLKNATEAKYQIDDAAPVSFNGQKTLTVGDTSYAEGTITTLKLIYSNGAKEFIRSFKFEKIDLLPGGFNVINLNKSMVTSYDLYVWSWKDKVGSSWSQPYTYNEEKSILLVTGMEEKDGFLLAIFEKGHQISDLTKWDDAVLKQTGNINISAGFYDASGFVL